MTAQVRSRYVFDDVVIEPASLQVWKAGQLLALEPKAFKVLLFLVENRGRVITKDELLQMVWQDTFVTDNALTRVIAQLRKALGDDAREPRYIETAPTQGYRFIAEVTSRDELTEDHATEHPQGLAVSGRFLVVGGVLLVLGAVATLIVLQSRSHPATALPSAKHITQVTASVGLDMEPTFSPDGSSIAYVSDRSGHFEIYVRPISSGGREIRITNDGGENMQPAWSPDGRFLAFFSLRRGGICVVPALGGVIRQLTDFGTQPAWSRDSSSLVFRSAGYVSAAPLDLSPVTPSTIWMVRLDGGPPREVTRTGSPPGTHSAPVWSADGTHLFFVSYTEREANVWSIPAAGGEPRKLLSDSKLLSRMAASPDGASLYYSAFARGGERGVWRLPLTATAGAEPVEILPLTTSVPRDLAISADGKRLAYSSTIMTSNLWSLPLDSSREAASEPQPLTNDTSYRNSFPVFSPDGKHLAYTVRREGLPGDLWVMDSDGHDPAPLSSKPMSAYMPNWLPDSSAVVYNSFREGRLGLQRLSLATRAEEEIKGAQTGAWARLSPDGKYLVFQQGDADVQNVWKTSVETGKTVRLTFDKESMAFPCWSPDGRWIAVETTRGNSTQLSVLPAEGGTPVDLTQEAGHHWPFSWDPTCDRIAYAGLRDGVWNLWWISRSSKAHKQLTRYITPRSFVRYPTWSPKGNQIAYEYAEAKGNVFMVELP